MTKIRASIQVAQPPADAFRHFTQGIDRWWPPLGRSKGAPQVFIEGEVGGRWYERAADGREIVWGPVLAWTPPHALVLAWQVGANGDIDAELATEVEVGFVAAAEGAASTLVTLEHRHLERYGAAAAAQEAALSSAVGWIGILERFAQHCAAERGAGRRAVLLAPKGGADA
jgi:uncharacterized protein YndB with AHSA1/START domain